MNYLLWELTWATLKTKTFTGDGDGYGYGYSSGYGNIGIGPAYVNFDGTKFWGDGDIGNGEGQERFYNVFGFNF